MRTGGYSIQQTLTSEAAATVRQAISLAKRRGHAQVTPLHVATAMLSSSTGLLRTACLQSHSHPLQFRALELCFNVALNRLPTAASSSPILPPLSHPLSLSNALVAAFKRAQAHQRRGSVENQQQPILTLKIELEQLVISILDDPSVSRVMREAGFSSTQVKTNVEQAVSLEVSCQTKEASSKFSVLRPQFSSLETPVDKVRSEDVTGVLESMMGTRRRNIIVVGECLASAEGVIKGVIEKFDRGEVAGDVRGVQFISLPLYSLKNVSIEEAEQKLGELRFLVKSGLERGIVLYLGDLKWVSDFWSSYGGNSRGGYYCPVKLIVMELNRLLCGTGESGKLWLMGIATFQTYMRCKSGHSSLETLWQLHPLTIPVGGLGLSLNLESDLQSQLKTKISAEESSWSQIKFGLGKKLTCCTDCLANFNREAGTLASKTCYSESTTTSICSSLPSWLQQYKEQNQTRTTNEQESNKLNDLCKKWNSICSSVHKQPHFLEKTLHCSSLSPSSSTLSSYDQLRNWPVIFEPKQSLIEHQFLAPDQNGQSHFESKLISSYVLETNDPKPDLLSNPNSSPNSASCSEVDEDVECLDRFKEFTSENLKVLCDALEKKVPWQADVIPDIVSTILQCRSKMIRRKGSSKHVEGEKEETWLSFLGFDSQGKEKIAKELSKLIFGSPSNLVKIGLSNFSSTRADSSEEVSKKRARDGSGSTYFERFAEAVQENPSRIFFMEDVEQIDFSSQRGIKRAIETGKFTLDGEQISLKDAIVIFSCESFSSMSRACSPPKEKDEEDDSEEERLIVSLNLNIATQDNGPGEDSTSEIGIMDNVDRQIIFKIQVL
ncbi:hypothetical protein NMG60_11008832 [Bertholletia excelsa]